jgi:hypothetical protein
MRWLNVPQMQPSLAIIDKHVADLERRPGGRSKLRQWFLAGDRNFNAITAERYIIGHLRQQNPDLVDNLQREGIDAYLEHGRSRIGIEVRILNGAVAEWILTECVTEAAEERGLLHNAALEITWSPPRLLREPNFVQEIVGAIESGDWDAIASGHDAAWEKPGVKVSRCSHASPGTAIAWDCEGDPGFPWFEWLTDKLLGQLREPQKVEQLARQGRNVVFVGVNHVAQSSMQCVFCLEDLGEHEDLAEGKALRCARTRDVYAFWRENMGDLRNVIGIGFFCYSLDSERPKYPMRIIWRSDEDRVPIKA